MQYTKKPTKTYKSRHNTRWHKINKIVTSSTQK